MEKKILDFISEVAIRTAIQRKAYSGNEWGLKKNSFSADTRQNERLSR